MIVIFGANGDLSKRKLIPALYHLQLEGLMPEDYRVIGTSRSDLTDQAFRSLALQAVEEFGDCEINDDHWSDFAHRLSYLSHDVKKSDPDSFRQAVEKTEAEMGNTPQRLFYLSVPPSAFGVITSALGAAGLQDRARVVYEKPFGESLDGFEALSREVHAVLDETQVYRIDHFLGKETVQNILAFRFANGMFEPSWNRHHIDHVQIEVLEEIGIGSRAGFYDKTGALRDMLVTHLFQLLGFVAMEPPPFLEARPLAEEVLKLFDSMKPLGSGDIVRG